MDTLVNLNDKRLQLRIQGQITIMLSCPILYFDIFGPSTFSRMTVDFAHSSTLAQITVQYGLRSSTFGWTVHFDNFVPSIFIFQSIRIVHFGSKDRSLSSWSSTLAQINVHYLLGPPLRLKRPFSLALDRPLLDGPSTFIPLNRPLWTRLDDINTVDTLKSRWSI